MNVIFFNFYIYWAFIFVIFKVVIERIILICRNFLWDGKVILNRNLLVFWENMCLEKKEGGLGIRDCELWNKVVIGKMVWDVVFKADKMWVKWVDYLYIKGKNWWGYNFSIDIS